MSRIGIAQMCARVSRLMASRLGLRGVNLSQKLRQGRGKLPRRVRRAAAELERAEALAANPRLARRCDPARVEPHYRRCLRYLSRRNRGAALKAWLLSLAAQLALALLVMLALALVITRARGFW